MHTEAKLQKAPWEKMQNFSKKGTDKLLGLGGMEIREDQGSGGQVPSQFPSQALLKWELKGHALSDQFLLPGAPCLGHLGLPPSVTLKTSLDFLCAVCQLQLL